MLPAQPNRSLIDGIDVLLALAAAETGVGSRELARRLCQEPTRTNRLLKTLAAAGLAAQEPHRRYVVGPAIHVLSAMSLFGSGLVSDAIPSLERLGELQVIVALGVLWRDQVAYLYHSVPGMSPLAGVGRAGLYPATRSSIGLALLAHKSQSELDRLYPLGKGPEARTTATRGRTASATAIPGFRHRAALRRRLAKIRREGIAVVRYPDGESRAAGVVVAGQSPYVAVGISGNIPADRSEEFNEALATAARSIADAAARRREGRSKK